MSRKPCSSNSEHSHRADSTSASAVALPYLAISRLSSEPALTPIRMGMPASLAARAISPTLSSKALMLPGLTRTAAQPASIAANTYLGWKWMSAITGICDFLAIAGSASASSWDGTATRTIWQPDAVSSAICCSVALTSAVSVVAIDWTDTGAPPPTGTDPTISCREMRRSASGRGGVSGRPRSILIFSSSISWVLPVSQGLPAITPGTAAFPDTDVTVLPGVQPLVTGRSADVDRIHQVGQDQRQAEDHQDGEHAHADRHQLGHVYQTGVGPPAQAREPGPDPLVDHDRDVPAVQRQQREQVERADEDVQRGDDEQDVVHLDLPAHVGRHHVAGDLARADHAGHLAGRGAGPVLGEQV